MAQSEGMRRWVLVVLLSTGCGSAAHAPSPKTTPDAGAKTGPPSSSGAGGGDGSTADIERSEVEASADINAEDAGADVRQADSDADVVDVRQADLSADAQDAEDDADAACPFLFPYLSETVTVTVSECTNGQPDVTVTEQFGVFIGEPLPLGCLHRFNMVSETRCTILSYKICTDTLIDTITAQPDGTFVGTRQINQEVTCTLRGMPQ
jgi:hypothetical protein